jgi:hypothetical protein
MAESEYLIVYIGKTKLTALSSSGALVNEIPPNPVILGINIQHMNFETHIQTAAKANLLASSSDFLICDWRPLVIKVLKLVST